MPLLVFAVPIVFLALHSAYMIVYCRASAVLSTPPDGILITVIVLISGLGLLNLTNMTRSIFGHDRESLQYEWTERRLACLV